MCAIRATKEATVLECIMHYDCIPLMTIIRSKGQYYKKLMAAQNTIFGIVHDVRAQLTNYKQMLCT